MNASTLRLALAATVLASAPATGQVAVDAEAGLYSAYRVRGLTTTSRPVAQGTLEVHVPRGGVELLVGAWANVELATYDGVHDISMAGGERGPNLTELDLYADATRQVGPASLTLGAVAFLYPNRLGATSEDNTGEAYGTLALEAPLSPELTVYYDVLRVRGAYLEGSVEHAVPVGRAHVLTVGATAGYSAGQATNPSHPGEVAYFQEDGFTHLDLSASSEFSLGAVSVGPALHVSFGADPLTRVAALDQERRAIVWFGGTLRWGGALPKR